MTAASGGEGSAGKIHEWWMTTPVELQPGEEVRYEGPIFLRTRWPFPASYGHLFLTTKRLIWIRYRLRLPRVRDVDLPLRCIETWTIEPAPWWWGYARRSLRIRIASATFEFLPRYGNHDAEEWAKALETVCTLARETQA